jgi:predicted DNA-binding protein YlxM (UPF0122 family)
MITKLGGPPDVDEEENNRLMEAFETTSKSIKDNLSECKDMLKIYISKSHDSVWQQSTDRTRLDEELKSTFSATEEQLQFLRKIFKKY